MVIVRTHLDSLRLKVDKKPVAWELLKKYIFATSYITGCSSPKWIKAEFLFRASEHNFLASAFHQRYDNKGPTLTIVWSADGHIYLVVLTLCLGNPIKVGLMVMATCLRHHRKNFAVFSIKFMKTTLSSSGNIPTMDLSLTMETFTLHMPDFLRSAP